MLGWAGEILGKRYKTPVFNGANYEDVLNEMKVAGLPDSGKIDLWDGRSGDKIASPVAVGVM